MMNSPRPHRWLLPVLLLAAFLLRAWQPGRMSVEHFDEGVYASNLYSDHLDFSYPDRHLYAPPFLPAVFEWVLILTGANARAVMWVNVVLGTALVAAVWWTARRFTGHLEDEAERDSAALAAAALVAFSDFLIQYSRAALTDVAVCLWMTLAVGAGLLALDPRCRGSQSRGTRTLWIALAAALTALAWWTKYNGWLPLAILGAGSAGWMLCSRPPPGEFLPVLGRWGAIAVGAFLLWSPYLWSLQEQGGYAAVAANHAGYVVGWQGWWDSLVRQLAIERHYAKGVTGAALYLAVLFAGGGFRWESRAPMPHDAGEKDRSLPLRQRLSVDGTAGVVGLLAIALFTVFGLLPLLVATAFAGVLSLIKLAKSGGPEQSLEGWILAAWLIGLAVATPLYQPYPRLLLPWLTGATIAGGIGTTLLVSRLRRRREARSAKRTREGHGSSLSHDPGRRVSGILVAGLLALLVSILPSSPAWQDRRGLDEIAGRILQEIRRDLRGRPSSQLEELDFIVYILAEPGLYYHLASREDAGPSEFITQPASTLGMLKPGGTDPRVPAYLVLGPHAQREREELAQYRDRITPIGNFDYRRSDLVLLDEFPPRLLERHRDTQIDVWRIAVQ